MSRDDIFFWLLISPITVLLTLACIVLTGAIPALIISLTFGMTYLTSLEITGTAILLCLIILIITRTGKTTEQTEPSTPVKAPDNSLSYLSVLLTGYWLHRIFSK